MTKSQEKKLVELKATSSDKLKNIAQNVLNLKLTHTLKIPGTCKVKNKEWFVSRQNETLETYKVCLANIQNSTGLKQAERWFFLASVHLEDLVMIKNTIKFCF